MENYRLAGLVAAGSLCRDCAGGKSAIANALACHISVSGYLIREVFYLDTRRHAEAYKQKQADGSFSVDDFLYTRCAVIAEGKDYYEKILNNPVEMPADIDFEHLLGLADEAFKIKTGKELDYLPFFNYETHSNEEGWK